MDVFEKEVVNGQTHFYIIWILTFQWIDTFLDGCFLMDQITNPQGCGFFIA
jgi:hypothetical protein